MIHFIIFIYIISYVALIYAIFLILSVAYWFFYESIQQGRRYFSSGNNSSTVTENSGSEMIKFGTRYGAVASH